MTTVSTVNPFAGDEPVDPQLAEPFEVHRRSRLYAFIAVVALVLAGAYAWFAYDRTDWVLVGVAGVLVLLSAVFALSLRDFGAPLIVADLHGVRLQSREGWIGLLWREIESFRVVRRSGLLGPQLQIVAHNAPEVYLVPLGLATDMSAKRAEVELAKRRNAAAY